ncbi:MAG: abortive infection protein [Candidatus Limnocylindrales bacterium]
MNRRGVSYDVGRVMGVNWRPVFDPQIVHRELAIIRHDLHCTAVRICGRDIDRLTRAAEDALTDGLEVWLSPELWDKSPDATLAYIVKAATAAEALRVRWPERLVFVVGSELTLFMQGIVPGRNIVARMANPSFWANAKAGTHNAPLNAFLGRAVEAVRRVYHGPLSYASLVWEAVDWSRFDIVGVDHYRHPRINEQYVEMLAPLFATGKPVVVTEFGCRTFQGAESASGIGSFGMVDSRSLFLHALPLVGRFVRPRLTADYVRDEELPAHELTEALGILDRAGVDGAFVMTFVAPIAPYDDDPRHDLDMSSFALVKTYADGRHGATYPDMPWEPKASFRAVADYYASAAPSPRSL